MISINEAKRLIKRALLSNIVCDKPNLAITPLVSGKHGIGKSAMIKSIAEDLGGICITVEGGTLKEGEITGLPYQYKDDDGKIKFRFLPYYAIERIQNEEKRIFEQTGGMLDISTELSGDENRYAMNNLNAKERIEAIKSKKIKPVIIFIDEINRTENTVYKELMNILLTRSVNGYQFPWWVLFVGAMNPSTQNSVYATNEMDPAQLDRFIKIKVGDNSSEWLKYGKEAGISPSILSFIKDNPKCLSSSDRVLDDDEKPTPSPRGWDMVDTLLSSEPLLRDFFDEKENQPKVVEKDMKNLVTAKLGATVATMFFASMVSQTRALLPEEILEDDEKLSKNRENLEKLAVAKKVQTCDLMLNYLKENIEFIMLNKPRFEIVKKQLTVLVRKLDSSTRLLFAQNIAATNTDDGNSMIELLFDVFESDLIEMLDLSDKTRKLIEESK
ncbi:MAG: AAA family ATPase [Lachnospiraceae bacterium]|nr:AAA family ATPase [Lachnospiraceae bacterium]